MEFYHIDRSNNLSMGTVNLLPAPNIVIKHFFPDGISNYGMQHFKDERYFNNFTKYNLSEEPLITSKDILSLPFNFNNKRINFNIDFFKDKCVTPYSPFIDLVFELVRRSDFPEKPSRLQSMFVWKNLKDAASFRSNTKYCQDKNPDIYKVEGNNFFEADMNLLRTGKNIADILCFAYKYWSGKKSRKPVMEVLLRCPATITGIVSNEEITSLNNEEDIR